MSMLTLSRERDVQLEFQECTVEARVRILTPAEFARLHDEKMSTGEILCNFVTSLRSDDIEGWQDGVSPSDVLSMPGTASIVAQAALAVVNGSTLTPKEKN